MSVSSPDLKEALSNKLATIEENIRITIDVVVISRDSLAS